MKILVGIGALVVLIGTNLMSYSEGERNIRMVTKVVPIDYTRRDAWLGECFYEKERHMAYCTQEPGEPDYPIQPSQ